MGNLPSAGSYHGMFAHVHATGRGYFAHAGNWLELVNREINNGIETVCLISAMPNQFISSSRVKEIAGLGGEFNSFIPEKIYQQAKNKLKGEK